MRSRRKPREKMRRSLGRVPRQAQEPMNDQDNEEREADVFVDRERNGFPSGEQAPRPRLGASRSIAEVAA